jgi:sugar/nucleoside kinase (ribokinase family)
MLADAQVVEQVSSPARVVDTLDAGDALIAGVVAAILDGGSRSRRSNTVQPLQQIPAAAWAHGAWTDL